MQFPINPYGKAKKMAEDIILDFSKSKKADMAVMILRLALLSRVSFSRHHFIAGLLMTNLTLLDTSTSLALTQKGDWVRHLDLNCVSMVVYQVHASMQRWV